MNMSSFPKEIRGYRPIGLCGQGAYGQVWLVQDFSDRWFALKIIYKRALGGDWKREYNGLVTYHQKVKRHPNLIEIYHIEDSDAFFYYTMECADNFGDENEYIPSTLENWIQRFGKLGPESVENVFDQILDGVEALHEAGVIHRDIKPDNIIFVNHIPKLSDIGLMTSMSQSISLVGTQPYLPPEVISGNSKTEESSSIDLYAVGKSIYRAFSGDTPDNFPKVNVEILSDKKCKKLNKLVKIACHPKTYARFSNIDSFRTALLKGVTFKTILFSFWAFIANILSNIFFYPISFCKMLWRNDFARNLLIILFFIAILFSLSGYIEEFYFNYLGHQDYYNALTTEERKVYNKMLAERMNAQEKRNLLAQKQNYEEALLNIKSESYFEGFKSASEVEVPRKRSLIYNERFWHFGSWVFRRKKNIAFAKGSIISGENGRNDMALRNLELPEDYEISFTLIEKSGIDSLKFIVYNIHDPADPDYPNNRRFYSWGFDAYGNFRDLKLKTMCSMHPPKIKIKPYIAGLKDNKRIEVSIIKKGQLVRIFCNGKLIYKPLNYMNNFKGGSFRMILESAIEVDNLSIYDITPRGFTGKILGSAFEEPDNKYLVYPNSVKKESYKYPYYENFMINNDNWRIIPRGSAVIKDGKFIPQRECILVFKHKLPANFKLNLDWKKKWYREYFEIRLLNKYSENSTFESILQENQGSIIRLNNYDTPCEIFDIYSKYGLKKLQSIQSCENNISLEKLFNYIKVNGKPALLYGVKEPKYLAFYFSPKCKNILLWLEISKTETIKNDYLYKKKINVSEMVQNINDSKFTKHPFFGHRYSNRFTNEYIGDAVNIELSEILQKAYENYIIQQAPVNLTAVKLFISSQLEKRKRTYGWGIDHHKKQIVSKLIVKFNLTLPKAKRLVEEYILEQKRISRSGK